MRFGSAWRACASIYNPHPRYFSHIFAKNNNMTPKKRVNRRRAKTVDERGNRIKVKVDRKGNFKRAKTYSDEPINEVIDKVGRLHQDVQKRQRRIAANKRLKRIKRDVKRAATETSQAYEDRIRRKAKIKDISKLKNKG